MRLAIVVAVVITCASASANPIDPDSFDHTTTGYALIGVHAATPCARCHSARDAAGVTVYTGLTRACSGCHQTPHAGKAFFRGDCGRCHSPTFTSMKTTSPAHVTALGKHLTKVTCEGCHTPARGVGPADITCERCHRAPTLATKTSPHAKRFDAFACDRCHRLDTWRPSAFDHRSTGFALWPDHSQLRCRQCHRGRDPSDFEKFAPKAGCRDCHAHRNVHDGKYGNDLCRQCHLNPGPPPRRGPPFLDVVHGVKGTFPLIKMHKSVPCADCHQRKDKKGKTAFDGLSPNCNSGGTCHDGDPHQGKLGVTCTTCHVGGTWDATSFDHAKSVPTSAGHTTTAYPLRGPHAAQACNACHTGRDFSAAPVACVGCHADEDAHSGSLGRSCENCHHDTGEITFDHARTRYPLAGKHRDVACVDCHPNQTFKPRPTKCAGCHPVPAFHRQARTELAWFDDDCGGCHSTSGW